MSSASRETDRGLHERLHPDAPDIAAQAVFAAREEWATSADDVLRRRTSLAARGLAGPELTAAVAELLERANEDLSQAAPGAAVRLTTADKTDIHHPA